MAISYFSVLLEPVANCLFEPILELDLMLFLLRVGVLVCMLLVLVLVTLVVVLVLKEEHDHNDDIDPVAVLNVDNGWCLSAGDGGRPTNVTAFFCFL